MQYNAIPGDITNAYSFWGNSCGANTAGDWFSCNGNGNRILDVVAAPNEDLIFWIHLSLSGMLPDYFRQSSDDQIHPGITVPDAGIDNAVFEAFYSQYDSFPNTYNISKNVIILGQETNVWKAHTGFLLPKEAKNIDDKIDDGLANSGNIQSVNGISSVDGTTSQTGCINSNNYDLSSSSKTCLMYRILLFK